MPTPLSQASRPKLPQPLHNNPRRERSRRRSRADHGERVHYTTVLRPMTAGRTGVTATAIHQGRTRQLWQAGLTAAGRRLSATGQVRLQNAGPRP